MDMDKSKEKQLIAEAKEKLAPKRGKKTLFFDLEVYKSFTEKCEKNDIGVSKMLEQLMRDFVK